MSTWLSLTANIWNWKLLKVPLQLESFICCLKTFSADSSTIQKTWD